MCRSAVSGPAVKSTKSLRTIVLRSWWVGMVGYGSAGSYSKDSAADPDWWSRASPRRSCVYRRIDDSGSAWVSLSRVPRLR